MQEEINYWVKKLGLIPHPEGGFYKETYRSEGEFSSGRNWVTSIYFLLTSENCSRFHQIKSDELWFHHAGSTLIVHTIDQFGKYTANPVGNLIESNFEPYFLVPANTIFGSTVRDKNSFSLVSCVVSPGFNFNDFQLFERNELLEKYPKHKDIITQLT